jgi:MFS family permease
LLFAIWSAVGMLAEVPCGMVADRFSRRSSLVVGGILQATGYAAWTVHPDFPGFALGFALWGLGGAFVSGATEALLYEGLAARGAGERFPDVLGRVTSAGLLAQLPAAAAATILFRVGGYPLVGWASVGTCLGAAAVARSIPESRDGGEREQDDAGPGCPAGAGEPQGTLRAALSEVRGRPLVRAALLAVAALTGLDAFEEYVPLLAAQWSVPVSAIPLAVLGLPLAGALGAAWGGRMGSTDSTDATDTTDSTDTDFGRRLGRWLGASGLLLLGATLLHVPAGLLAVFAFYGLYQAVLVAAGARLQQRIEGRSRATVTSLAALAGELTAFATYAAWALAGAAGVVVLVLGIAVALPYWFAPARDRG